MAIEEAYASILLGHILTPFPTGYVDLRSPAGAGLGAIVYNMMGECMRPITGECSPGKRTIHSDSAM